ncbi:hypothetical protein CEN50_19030 [Fischerella thermalis CCMEE 5268]|uniref:Uncharacterized protein n=1 Tax=Fischerella thermalis CCMEE 5268 TaxID=2019662 RepID=A0A2N6KCG3_9CYAN|nr:hypothetical protein CEN50_19030 [Fischerella thermalis CCMEE 5268]
MVKLGVHYVKPGVHQLAWDLGFLGSGVLLIVVGWILTSNYRKNSKRYLYKATGREPALK